MRRQSHKETPHARRSSKTDPRAYQKARTRKAIVAAASDLLSEGSTPTVGAAAQRAEVSRATAYRYFPTQEHLLLELGRLIPASLAVDELMKRLPRPVPERLAALARTFNSAVIGQEATMRTIVRAGLDTWLQNHSRGIEVPVREGRRMAWLDRVLEPVRRNLTPRGYQRLRAALALTLGPDSVFIMKDVCGLDDADALAVLQWAAQALLAAGLNETSTNRRE